MCQKSNLFIEDGFLYFTKDNRDALDHKLVVNCMFLNNSIGKDEYTHRRFFKKIKVYLSNQRFTEVKIIKLRLLQECLNSSYMIQNAIAIQVHFLLSKVLITEKKTKLTCEEKEQYL